MRRNSRIHCLDTVYYITLFVIGIWFFFLLGRNGYVLEKDSYSFIEGKQAVLSFGYIVYPMISSICRSIFGELYIEVLFILQSILALLTSFAVAEYIRRVYGLTRKMGLLVFALSFGPYTYTLPQYVANHGILTEGIAFPLFNLWMICAIEIYRNKKKIWYIAMFILSILLAMTRPQLLVFCVIFVILLIDTYYRKHNISAKKTITWKEVLIIMSSLMVLLVVGIFAFCGIVKKSYFPQLTDAVSGRVLCTIQENDEKLFTGEMKILYETIYDAVDENGDRDVYFRKDYKRWEDICVSTNNNTKLMGKIISENRELIDETYHEFANNEIKGELVYPLLISHWDSYMVMTWELFVQSLVVAIFVHPDGAYLFGCSVAVVLYVVSILLFFVLKKRNMWEYILPMRIVMIVITFLCGLTNVVFMGIQRYVVYPFGWFYIAVVVMLYRFIPNIRTIIDERKRNNNG